MLLPSKDEILSLTCKIFIGNNGTFVETKEREQPPIDVLETILQTFGFALWCFFWFIALPRLVIRNMNKESRNVLIIVQGASLILEVLLATFIFMLLHGIEKYFDIMIVLMSPDVTLLHILTKMNLEDLKFRYNNTTTSLLSRWLFFVFLCILSLQIFPQTANDVCDSRTLMFTSSACMLLSMWLIFVHFRSAQLYSSVISDSFMVLEGRKDVAKLVKKNGEWVRIPIYSEDSDEKDKLMEV